ncbi:MAG: penicillin acylase family protein [Nannocystaceae bacterium]
MSRARQLFRLLLGPRPPITHGELTVAGIAGPLTIRRCEFGVPYIDAESDEDAWFGLGYCQGQDRAFQLEALLRLGRGTLCQLLGARPLALDRLSRRVGFHRLACAHLERQIPAAIAQLEAFAAGVTAGASVGSSKPAHEFALLRGRPTPWRAADVIAVVLVQSFLLASNWDIELARLKILELDGAAALRALDPEYPSWLPVTSPPGATAGPALDRLADDLAILRATLGPGGASNAWAVAGSRTRSGRPILAGDPHLPASLPAHWYLAHVRTPTWAAVGAAMIGTPGIAAGHNGHLAWSVTAAHLDNTDLFVVEPGADGRSVRIGGELRPCAVIREVIKVRGDDDVIEEVLQTPHGPVIGPALHGEIGALAIQATWMRPQRIRGLLDLHRARSIAGAREILGEWPLMPLNVVCAESSGSIGWVLAGQAPRRRKGHGLVPLPASDPEVGWEDEPVPASAMPACVDPAAGYVASANNKPTAGDDPRAPYLGADWLDGYRVARISERLAEQDQWDLEGTLRLHCDQFVIPWRELRDRVLAAIADRRDLEPAAGILARWDGVAGAESVGATIYELLMAALHREVAEAIAPRAFAWALGRGFTDVTPHSLLCLRKSGHLVGLIVGDAPVFARGWPTAIADALARVQGRLRRERGEDPSAWRWGHVRTVTLRHPVGEKAALAPIFNRGPMVLGGDADTIPQASCPPLAPTGEPLAIASLRLAIDVGAWDDARFVLPGGISGNPLSPHYDDMLPLWERGEALRIVYSPERVAALARETLVLRPR